MFISKGFVVFFALLVSLAIAAPVVKERSPDELQLSARGIQPMTQAAKHMKKAIKIMRKIGHNFNPKPDKSVFWNGRSTINPHHSVMPEAVKFAKAQKKEVIHHALKTQGIRIPWPATNPHSQRLWNFASKTFAKKASGHVHAFIGPVYAQDSVYRKIEKPELLKNSKVTKLTEHNVGTGTSNVVK